jgi:hypothetical protein
MYCQIPPTYLHMTLENTYTKEEFVAVVLIALACINYCIKLALVTYVWRSA